MERVQFAYYGFVYLLYIIELGFLLFLVFHEIINLIYHKPSIIEPIIARQHISSKLSVLPHLFVVAWTVFVWVVVTVLLCLFL